MNAILWTNGRTPNGGDHCDAAGKYDSFRRGSAAAGSSAGGTDRHGTSHQGPCGGYAHTYSGECGRSHDGIGGDVRRGEFGDGLRSYALECTGHLWYRLFGRRYDPCAGPYPYHRLDHGGRSLDYCGYRACHWCGILLGGLGGSRTGTGDQRHSAPSGAGQKADEGCDLR